MSEPLRAATHCSMAMFISQYLYMGYLENAWVTGIYGLVMLVLHHEQLRRHKAYLVQTRLKGLPSPDGLYPFSLVIGPLFLGMWLCIHPSRD